MDRRSERSRRAIQDAFLELLEELPYDQITVTNVLARAHVGRATFYAHFHGKEDLPAVLVAYVCKHALAPEHAEASHDFTGHSDAVSVVEHMLCHLRSHDCGMHALLVGGGAHALADALYKEIARRAREQLPQALEGPAAAVDRELLVNHIAGSFVEMVLWWSREDFAADPHELAKGYLTLILGLLGKNLG